MLCPVKPPPTKHSLATLLCVLVLWVWNLFCPLTKKPQQNKQTKCLLLISLCPNLDQATCVPFTFPLCILEKLITPLSVQPCTPLHTLSALFIALLYMHATHSQAHYSCYFSTGMSIIKETLHSDCLVVQMCGLVYLAERGTQQVFWF